MKFKGCDSLNILQHKDSDCKVLVKFSASPMPSFLSPWFNNSYSVMLEGYWVTT